MYFIPRKIAQEIDKKGLVTQYLQVVARKRNKLIFLRNFDTFHVWSIFKNLKTSMLFLENKNMYVVPESVFDAFWINL